MGLNQKNSNLIGIILIVILIFAIFLNQASYNTIAGIVCILASLLTLLRPAFGFKAFGWKLEMKGKVKFICALILLLLGIYSFIK